MSKGREQPEKPRSDFPLFPHQNGQWAKKIRGKLHYFGPWSDPMAAETKYLDDREYLQAGRTPPDRGVVGCRIRDLVNRFLTTKKSLLETGELSPLTFQDYHRTSELLVGHFGRDRLVEDISVQDLEAYRSELAKSRGLHALGNEINRSRILFRYAFEQGLIDRPLRFGQGFRRPSRTVVKRDRQQRQQRHGLRMFEARDVQAMIKAANPVMKAMVLLGINCGFGPTDIANCPKSAIDAKSNWIDYPRPKTAAERRIPLWPETAKAVKEAIAVRPTPRDPENERLVFVTRNGEKYVRVNERPAASDDDDEERIVGTIRNSVSERFSALLQDLGLKRPGLGFYALRHTFETVGGESRDQVAVDAIMGHADQSMASLYRERISDERLLAVTNHVRTWLFATTKGRPGKPSRR